MFSYSLSNAFADMMKMIFSAEFPFSPKKVSFYYGWVILGVAMLASISSIPGQTAGFSPFTEPLLERLGITRTQLSSCYLQELCSVVFCW